MPKRDHLYPEIDISKYYEHADKGSNTPREVSLRWQEFNSPELSEPVIFSTRPKTAKFHCPYPGCHTSTKELWRLRDHFRAIKWEDGAQGSGVVRGHNAELTRCPKCGCIITKGCKHTGKMCKGVASVAGQPCVSAEKLLKAAGKRSRCADQDEEDECDTSDAEEAAAPIAPITPPKRARTTCTTRATCTRSVDYQAPDLEQIDHQAIDHQATEMDPIDHQAAEAEQEPPYTPTDNTAELAATDVDAGPLLELASSHRDACEFSEPPIPQMMPLQLQMTRVRDGRCSDATRNMTDVTHGAAAPSQLPESLCQQVLANARRFAFENTARLPSAPKAGASKQPRPAPPAPSSPLLIHPDQWITQDYQDCAWGFEGELGNFDVDFPGFGGICMSSSLFAEDMMADITPPTPPTGGDLMDDILRSFRESNDFPELDLTIPWYGTTSSLQQTG